MDVVLLQQLSKPLDMAGNSESCSSSGDSDVLMMDPFLDYINEILMEEGMDEATCMQQFDHVSYQAIFSGFYDILGEHSPPDPCVDSPLNSFYNIVGEPNSCVDSTGGDGFFDPHQHIYGYHENCPDEQQVKVVNPKDGSNEPKISLSPNGHPQSSFQHQRAEVGFTLKHDSGFQVMASHTPLKSSQITELHEMKNVMYNSDSRLNSTGLNEAGFPLSSKVDTMGQISHNAIELNDDKALSGHICMGGLEQGYSNFKLPSADEEFSAKLAEVDTSFEDLRLNAVYTDLYAGETSSLCGSTRASREKKKSLAGACNNNKSGKKSTSEEQVSVDVREVLVSCAQAVAIGDARKANEILQELRQAHGASADGTGLQRTAHFFSEALAARLRGIGEQHFRAICQNMPSATMILMASKLGFVVNPFQTMIHYFANQSILKAAEGASRLHVVDFGLLHGLQWPYLINALADRKGGPPLLVITGVESPRPGINLAEKLEESGRRLAAYAKTYGVPFQYHAIVTNKWEDLDAASLHVHEGEILVVNCLKRLRHLADDSADLALTISPRQKFLTCMHSLNPHLLVTAVVNAACNSPFVSRFRQALYYFSNIFDMLETLWGDTPQRLIVERSCFYRDIVNIVACEGAERAERPETYKQWHARITKAGFKLVPIPTTILSRARSHVKQHHHKDFLIDDDANGWMLMGWKGRITIAISAWKPSIV